MEIIKEIDEYLKNNMSQKRYIHSVGVMNKAKELANKHNIDEEKAMVVGLAHDIAKELNAKEINNYISPMINVKNNKDLNNKIRYMLTYLKNKNLIENIGTDKKPQWVIK